MAAIGEKEWYFYVPRDRKYRNGDRPNRVTTSGYWKATGADRMIRGENFRAIGLKKTLVFYSGKAPKGIRTSWIMNEYRLPQQDTERYQKGEISLCRVYKRAGVEDHPSVPRGTALQLPSRLSSSSRATSSSTSERKTAAFKGYHHQQQVEAAGSKQHVGASEADASSSTEVGTALGLSQHGGSYSAISPLQLAAPPPPPNQPSLVVEAADRFMHIMNHHQHHQQSFLDKQQGGGGGGRGEGVIPILPSSSNSIAPLFMANPSPSPSSSSNPHHHHHQSSFDEIQRLVEYQQACLSHHLHQHQHQHQHQQQQQQQQFQFQALNNTNNATTPNSSQFLFSNYLFSPSQQAPPLGVVPTVASSTSLQVPPPSASASSGASGVGFSDRLWEWNPFPEQPNLNRDHFNNPFK